MISGNVLTLLARFVLATHGLDFGSPVLYTAAHQTVIAAVAATQIQSRLLSEITWTNARGMAFLGLAEALTILTNNFALRFASVSLNQSIKALVPIALTLLAKASPDTHGSATLCLAVIVTVCNMGLVSVSYYDDPALSASNAFGGVAFSLLSMGIVVVRFKMMEQMLFDTGQNRWIVMFVQGGVGAGGLLALQATILTVGGGARLTVTPLQAVSIVASAAVAAIYTACIIFLATRLRATRLSYIAVVRQALLLMAAIWTEGQWSVDAVVYTICIVAASVAHSPSHSEFSYTGLKAATRLRIACNVAALGTVAVATLCATIVFRVDARWAAVVVPRATKATSPCAGWEGSAQLEFVYATYAEPFASVRRIVEAARVGSAPLTAYQGVDAPSRYVPSFQRRNITIHLQTSACVRVRYHPNVQDEGGAYLHFIIDRHTTLPKHVAFVKGSFDDFVPSWQGFPSDEMWVYFARSFQPSSDDTVDGATYASMPTQWCRSRNSAPGVRYINDVLKTRRSTFRLVQMREGDPIFSKSQFVATRAALTKWPVQLYEALQQEGYFPSSLAISSTSLNQKPRHGNNARMTWLAFALEKGGWQSILGGAGRNASAICIFMDQRACKVLLETFEYKQNTVC